MEILVKFAKQERTVKKLTWLSLYLLGLTLCPPSEREPRIQQNEDAGGRVGG